MSDSTVTLGEAALNTVKGFEADAKAVVAKVENPITLTEKGVSDVAAKIKADAKAAVKEVIVAVGSRAFYAMVGAVAMFTVMHVL